MKKRFLVLKTLLAFAAGAFLSGLNEAAAQGTAFTYHGQLKDNGAPVSAVIEMPDAFTLYVAKEKTGETLTVLICSIPKRSYEQYLTEQAETSLTAR